MGGGRSKAAKAAQQQEPKQQEPKQQSGQQQQPPAMADDGEVYELKKVSAGCTGMFWRADPRGKTRAPSDNWPRDGALLKGEVHEVDGEKWLECTGIKQLGAEWATAPDGAFMPFVYAQYRLEPAEA